MRSEVLVSEFIEFASFEAKEQRYIGSSLCAAFDSKNAIKIWARNGTEETNIRAQIKAYEVLVGLREVLPVVFHTAEYWSFLSKLLPVASFDLGRMQLQSFSGFRFLYERLLGAQVRSMLPSVFCAAAALPTLPPDQRKKLLQSISEAAATAPGWSPVEPTFNPVWVDKVEQYI